MPIKITEHAYERAKERLRFKSEVLDKMAAVAYEEGLKHSESKGLLKKYITSLFFQYGKANNIRIYGEVIYLFASSTLITVYQVPSHLKKYLKLRPGTVYPVV